MAVNNSDYNKTRTNLLDVTNESFKSETNVSLIENTFNRMLTKDETVEISGVIGDADPASRSDRRIIESDVHRQGYQLQPIMHSKVATVDHATTSKDLYNRLARLGVDVDRLPIWGDTERFNFAPPVDLDKLTNYTDYYWYDETDSYVVPQYVVIKNRCFTHTARLSQKQREIAGIGESTPIFNASVNENTISILGNLASSFLPGTQFDITGSQGVDGVYEVVSAVFKNNFTVITPSPAIPSAMYGGGHLTFDTVTRKLTQIKNSTCEGSIGWAATSWDDSSRPENSGHYIDDVMLLAYIREESPDTFYMIAQAHPEYITQVGTDIADWIINATDARPLWKWMDSPEPEFTHKWDGGSSLIAQNDWQVENKWIHKLDLPAGAVAKATRASMPIIEYLPNLELNEWSYTAHKWMHRNDPILDEFAAVDFEPTYDDYWNATTGEIRPDFFDKWIYVGPSETVPINHQTENSSARVMSIDSLAPDFKLEPFVGTGVISSTSNAVVLDGTFAAQISAAKIKGQYSPLTIHTPMGIHSYDVLSLTTLDKMVQVTVSSDFVDIPTPGDIAMVAAGTRPFNVALFPITTDPSVRGLDENTVAGQQNTRVYVDTREQIGNYTELLNITDNAYVNGVILDEVISQQHEFKVSVDPSAEADKDRIMWRVRTTEFMNDRAFLAAGSPTVTICPIRYRFHQQQKQIGITKFPLFDIYYPTGETAHRANELFTFVLDPEAAVEAKIGLRIKVTGSKKIYHFKQLLLDFDNGPMFCYKDFDEIDTNPTALFTIWRTNDSIRYVPRYVNAQRRANGDEYYIGNTKMVAEVSYGTGDWEVPSQLYFNSAHDNRIEVTSVQLLEHFNTILTSQATVDGFLPNPQYGHRLLEKVDYSVGGTIHDHNDSWDLLASALHATNTTPIDVLNFAATSYESAINAQEEYVLSRAYDALTNTSLSYVGNLTAAMTEDAIRSYELNDNNNRLFGDTTAFYNKKGVESWPATAPILALSKLYNPHMVVDDKLNIAEIRHHDGHYSYNRITQGALIAIAKRVVRTKVPGTGVDSSVRYRGWTPQLSADVGVLYQKFSDIPTSKLNAADYWLNGSEFKRFEVVAITSIAPSTDAPIGSLWLHTPDHQLMVRVDSSDTPWISLTVDGVVVPAGDVSAAWKDVNLTKILNDIVANIEDKLFDAATEHNISSLHFPVSEYVLNAADETLYNTLQERMFKEFVVSRQIAYPYASVYVQSNPFTWNVSGINYADVVWNPYVDNRPLNWKGTWQGNYLEVYGTMYPHLEPWCLQGFTSKPTWWDAEYKNTDATVNRRWNQTMWTKIIELNDVPATYEAPFEYTTVVINGRAFKRMARVYNFVPVNTLNAPLKTAAGDVLYGMDDLFPIFDSRLLAASLSSKINDTALGRPFVKTIAGSESVNFKASYKFGDVAPIEQEWIKSTQYTYDQLKIAFIMQPMRFMHRTWGLKYLNVGGLQINSETLKVFSHVDTIFHGDVIDDVTYRSNGINQWYSYYIRQTGIDLKVSNLRAMWTDWKAKLAYQFGGFVNTKSLSVRTTGMDLIKEDYTLFSKKSPGYDSKWIDSLNVTVANYGAVNIRNGVRVPQEDGKDWTFTVSLPAGNSRILSYYGTRRFTFSVVDESTGVMRINGAVLPWVTGDLVYVDTTRYLPFPLDVVYQYYITVVDAFDGTFTLSRVASEAHNGTPITLHTNGEGVQYIGQVSSTFFAYGGQRTDIAWKHHVLDKAQVIELASPFTVQGVQGLVDVIDGYIEYKKDEGFVFNDSSEKEVDENTSRILSWQTETERAIDTIYKGLGLNNSSVRQYGTTHAVTIVAVDDEPDVFQMTNGVFPYQYADRLNVFTTGSLPQGLSLNTTYFAIPDETDHTKFRLATTALNAYDEIGLNVTTVGEGTLSIGSFTSPAATVDDVVEINPFRYNLWINTPSGILSDVFSGGDSFNTSEVLMYDQYGRPLAKGDVMVFRKDKQAHIKVRPTTPNDVLIDNARPTSYNLIHLGGIKAYIDGYEHIAVFEDYATGGQMIYDAFVGMSVPRFSVEFERSENRNLRPNMGGYFMHGTDMLRNIEASIDDMRSYYRTYNVNENSDYVSYARDLLGYEDPSYLDHLNTPRKSKFLFWKGMIQQKGSRNAIRSFVNSEHFVDAKFDEFWAYKLADFGDARPRFKPCIRLYVDDGVNNDIRLEFTDVLGGTSDDRFKQIALDDQSRWVDLPTIRKDFGGRNMIFNARSKSFEFNVTDLDVLSDTIGGGYMAIVPSLLEGLIVEQQVVIGSVTTWEIVTAANYTQVNSRAIVLHALTTDRIRISGYVPDIASLDPIELIDTKSATTVQRTKYWNPIAGNHYHVPLTSIDIMSGSDPVNYEDGGDWAHGKTGTTWVDTSTFHYVPYEDVTIFPELNDRLERWGRLGSQATTKVYEWVESSVPPSMYVFDKTTSGLPLKVWMKQNSSLQYDEVDLSSIVSWVDHQSTFNKLLSRDLRLLLSVFVNGSLVENAFGKTILGDIADLPQTLAEQYGVRIQDHVTFALTPPKDLLDDYTYIQDYKYVTIQESAAIKYFFWVDGKTDRGPLHTLPVAEIANQLTTARVPYHIFMNFLPAPLTNIQGPSGSLMVPPRYTQVIVKDVASKVDVNGRYNLQFTRSFNLRDDLNAGLSPLDLKNKHTEWYIFRREQSDKIPEALWNHATEALVGYKLTDLDNGILTPVPSLERTVYDNTFGETSRFGVGDGQAFMDRMTGLKSVQYILESPTFDTAPVDKYAFFDSYSFDTPVNIKNALQYMFVNFSAHAVNTIFFELLMDALSDKRDYPGLFKTSWIALHGIKILETAGNVIE